MTKKIYLLQIMITVLVTLLSFPFNTIAQQWGLYTLYATKNGTQAYLIDTANTPVVYKTWTFPSTAKNAYSTYLIPGDTLVRTSTYKATGAPGSGGVTGKIQKVRWDGTVVWEMTYSSTTTQMHHDILPMPNGNVMFISYETKTATQATQAGSSSASTFYSEKIVEVKPTGVGTNSANWGYTVVWEWKLWDHLCQNYNSAKDNYVTSIVDNPQLLNINYTGSGSLPDRYHMNGLDYNAQLNQIVCSMHFMNSVFIIDHSTTTAEAAGHTGGVSGKGGDFLYRWGNPASYGASGTTIFNTIHDAHWVSSDNSLYPNYLCGYNNQGGTGGKTAIDVWNPPYNGNNYTLTAGQASPSTYAYQYNSAFTATNEGNSQQLPNGNMLVNNAFGNIYEVNSAGTTLWTKTAASSSHAYRYTKCYVRGPIVTASTSESSVCLGDSVTLNSNAVSVTEASPTYTYEWSSGETSQNPVVVPSANTVYTVTITNTAIGCSSTASVSVNVLSAPAIPVVTQNLNSLISTVANSYQWYQDGVLINGETNQSLDVLTDGQYQVEITDINGCTAISTPFSFIYSSINSNLSNESLEVYPNPTSGLINFDGNNLFNIIITNAFGTVVATSENINSFDLSNYSNGIYYLAITSKEGKVTNKKIILIK
ncbi:MAG: aryl-sulfate sulfotransferase [Bacteroidia bacterium]|nr:aryl-sulfate sulfotransferase [Bacteroidia bacterium]